MGGYIVPKGLRPKSDYNHAYYAKNKARELDRVKAYQAENRDVILARRERERAQQKAYRNAHPEVKQRLSWKIQKITIDGHPFLPVDFDRIYQTQKGACAVCHRHSSEFKRRLAVDHDHRTGVFRGLLCDRCNMYAGVLENTELKMQIEHYLRGG